MTDIRNFAIFWCVKSNFQSKISVESSIDQVISLIKKGVRETNDPSITPDTCAWAILALESWGEHAEVLDQLRSDLAKKQMEDGRIPLTRDEPQTFWPTPIVLLSFRSSHQFKSCQEKAIGFLLNITGQHREKKSEDSTRHDPSIIGWPWIEDTYSWIIPTSITILALKAYGLEQHERVREGIKMILDRQLPSGGWNYGNTVVFRSELKPIPECTGYALNALAGSIPADQIQKSIAYLRGRLATIRTPLSMAWGLMGLSAWALRPEQSSRWIVETLANQNHLGNYSINLLSQLVISYYAEKGLLSGWYQ